MNTHETRERLAAYAHDGAWAHWMKYLFSECYLAGDPDHPENDDGDLIIPGELVRRWRRQMNTSYADLPEDEKRSDRNQAGKILEILQSWQPVAEADYHHPDGLTMLHVEGEYLAISHCDGNGTWRRNTIRLPGHWCLCERKP